MVRSKNEIGGDETNSLETETSKIEPETTSETTQEAEEKITLTAKELRDRINAGRAELGRTLKSTLDAHSLLQRSYDAERAKTAKLDEAVKAERQRQREKDLKSAEGTDLIDSVRLKHQAEDEWEKVNTARSEFERERTQHLADLDDLAKSRAEKKANELAKESGMTADLLLLVGSDTGTEGRVTYNFKRMEAIAKSVPKGEEKEEEVVAEAEGETSAVRGQRSMAAGAGTRSAGRGLQTITDYYEAYNQGRITSLEMDKAKERFGVAY